MKNDKIRELEQHAESARAELANCQKQVSDLQDKFMQSSSHVMEETVRYVDETPVRILFAGGAAYTTFKTPLNQLFI